MNACVKVGSLDNGVIPLGRTNGIIIMITQKTPVLAPTLALPFYT